MRLPGYLPLSLFGIIPLTLAAQVSFLVPQQNASVLSGNIIDALSSDPDYTSLLTLLQKAKLIPTLNKLNESTFFAPTNDAIKQHTDSHPLWREVLDGSTAELRDNVQEQLRQELFYHLLNSTLSHEAPDDQVTEVLKTLHYPRKSTSGPPSRAPPPNPPWLPTPGGTLGGEPQRLRYTARDSKSFIGANAFGQGGVEVSKPAVNTSNGLLLGIGAVLDVPEDLGM